MSNTATPLTSLNMRALPAGLAGNATGLLVWSGTKKGYSGPAGRVDHIVLTDAWVGQDLDPAWLPPLPSAKVALTRAVEEMVRAKKGRKKERVVDAHWLVYDIHTSEQLGGASLTEEMHVRLNDARTGIIVTPDNHPMATELRDRWTENQTRLETRDLGAWIPKWWDDVLHTVPLESGPTFVKPEEVPTFQKFKAAMAIAAPHYHVGDMQAVRDDEAVQQVIDGILAQAAEEVETTEQALDAGELQGKGFRTAHKRCDAMLDKMEEYETLLGRSLDDVREKLGSLAAASGEAAIVADEKAAKERAAKKAASND